ncbi:MAG TPA: DinB family protein [Niabella sp.]|nr:DinB family protein [Niabella sp.]
MRPDSSQYPPYFEPYISKAEGDDIHSILPSSVENLKSFLLSIPETSADFAYASGKWTVKQVLQHCIDTERIFAYRALCIARGEKQPLPGFDQDMYVANSKVENKRLEEMRNEMLLVRQSSVMLFAHFTHAELNRTGTVSGNAITALALGFIIAGHWLHHEGILINKYGL